MFRNRFYASGRQCPIVSLVLFNPSFFIGGTTLKIKHAKMLGSPSIARWTCRKPHPAKPGSEFLRLSPKRLSLRS